MNVLKTDSRTTSRYVSNDSAAWLEHGETLGRLWTSFFGRGNR